MSFACDREASQPQAYEAAQSSAGGPQVPAPAHSKVNFSIAAALDLDGSVGFEFEQDGPEQMFDGARDNFIAGVPPGLDSDERTPDSHEEMHAHDIDASLRPQSGAGRNGEDHDFQDSQEREMVTIQSAFPVEFSPVFNVGDPTRKRQAKKWPVPPYRDCRCVEKKMDLAPRVTSLMISNIPTTLLVEEVLRLLFSLGFECAMDFFYMPVNLDTKRNKGYCFINLRSNHLANVFANALVGRQFHPGPGLDVYPADVQGLLCMAERHLHKSKSRIGNPWFKPMLFMPGQTAFEPWHCLPLNRHNLERALQLRETAGVCCVEDYLDELAAIGRPKLQ